MKPRTPSRKRSNYLLTVGCLVLAGVALVVFGALRATTEMNFALVLHRAQSALSQGETAQSLALLEALKANSVSQQIQLGEALCRAYLQAEEYESAQQAAASVLKLDPKNLIANWAMGRGLLFTGSASGAINYLRDAEKVNPGDALVKLDLSRAYIITGRYDMAVLELQAALEVDANNVTAHRLLGEAYQKLGRPAEAERELAWGR